MQISIIAFTENGIRLSKKLAQVIADDVMLYAKCSHAENEAAKSAPSELADANNSAPSELADANNSVPSELVIANISSPKVIFWEKSLEEYAKKQFQNKNALIFIGACGIAVRAIAPCVKDKLTDSPVLVIDEQGQYIIPILSGHVGGANELAKEIADQIGATAIITTATDINQKFAVDMFAKKNDLYIVNKDGIAKVSAKVLAGEKIKIVDDLPTEPVDVVIGHVSDYALLSLLPRDYAIGIGCKKGKSAEEIEKYIGECLSEAGVKEQLVFAIASIDVKKEEEGILSFSQKHSIEFKTYCADELQKAEGEFASSDFVKQAIGVDNVCERAAIRACDGKGKLIFKKHAKDGMTVAIAKRERRIVFDE